MENTNTKIIEWNTVIFDFTEWTENGADTLNFDFWNKPIESTEQISKLIQLTEFQKLSSPLVFNLVEQNLKKKVVLDIIATLRTQSDHQELSHTQKLSINGTDCLIIDKGDSISVMITSEVH